MGEGPSEELMAAAGQALPAASPIILTARLAPPDQQWAEALRRAHFPPERNLVPAHITLFHHLPPALEGEVRSVLARLTAEEPPPPAQLASVFSLGRGVAFLVESPALLHIRDHLAQRFIGLLTPQDAVRPRLHITVQNKVSPGEARATLAALREGFRARPLAIQGIDAWHYRGGPWSPIAGYSFRGR